MSNSTGFCGVSGGLEITIDAPPAGNMGNIFGLPALVGVDVSRCVGRLQVQIDGGKLWHPGYYEEPLTIESGEKVLGWGKLDGPAYLVGKSLVPKAVIDALVAKFGLSI